VQKLMRVADVAKELGISKPYAYKLIAHGRIPSVKIDFSTWIPRAAFDAWVAAREREALRNAGMEVPSDAGKNDAA